MATHLSLEELRAGLSDIRQAPQDGGQVQLIVARPSEDERLILDVGEVNAEQGLHGDTWRQRVSRRKKGSVSPDTQITLINARLAQLVAQSAERWALAGDQFFVDMDLSIENLPVGQRLELGTAVLEITDKLHSGCAKFSRRFGSDALKFVNQAEGRALRLRGVYARVVQPGQIKTGDTIRKI